MRATLKKYLYELRASYWFLPSLMAIGAIGLSLLTLAFDEGKGQRLFENSWWAYANKPDGARSVLSTIAGSMITVAGVTFSMTMVAVSFASSQFGPRLIGNYMRDRGNQITLGTFIGTFVYCLLILRTVRSSDDASDSSSLGQMSLFVPQLSMLCAIALALASVGVLIYFIHHIPETIDVSNITAHIGEELEESIDNLYPKQLGEPREDERSKPEINLPNDWLESAVAVQTGKNGYIQAIDDDGLFAIAKKHDLILRLQYRPGDFATDKKTLLQAWPAENVDDSIAQRLRGEFAWGAERTPTQNAKFLVDQLVEIIGRALSPGVNDPFTAISCLKWLQRSLATLSQRETPSCYRYDDEQHLRIVTHPTTFEDFCSAVFDQTRQYIAADRNVTLEAMNMIAELVAELPSGDRRKTLLRHADAMSDAAEQALPLDIDREAVKKRRDLIHRMIEYPEVRRRLEDESGWVGGKA